MFFTNSSLFFSRSPKAGVSKRRYAFRGNKIKLFTSRLYYDPARPSACSNLTKFAKEVAKKNKSDSRVRLEKQNGYTLHRPVRKRFARNPYNVNNVTELWECDLLEVSSSENTMISTDTFYRS